MIQAPNIPIDLGNPESIREKVPEISKIVAQKHKAAAEAQEDFDMWNQLLTRLKAMAGLVVRIEENDGNPETISQDALDAVVWAVEQAGTRIQPVGVHNALNEEGHIVAGREAVFHTLVAAARAGLLDQVGDRAFAPLDPPTEAREMVPVPEAHLGLDGPAPSSKAEAVLRVLGSESNRPWSTPEVAAVMVGRGWAEDPESELASLAATLSRLHAERKIHRPARGKYQLSPASIGGEDG